MASAGELPYKSPSDAGVDRRGVVSPLIFVPGASPLCVTGLALGCSGSVDLGAFALLMLLITTSLGHIVNAALENLI